MVERKTGAGPMMLLRNDARAQRLPLDRQSVRLLIVEQGAPSFEGALAPEDSDEVIVLEQFEGEKPMDLVVRTCTRISDLELAGKRVRQAVIALGPSLEPQLEETRRMLGLTILSHVRAVGADSELVLGMGANATSAFREHVLALVESLVGHPGSLRAPIRVRFAAATEVEPAPPPHSGIHPRSSVVAE